MLVVENLQKSYRRHAERVQVLHGLNLTVESGEFLSIVGASGSGKSTLLHLMGALDAPDHPKNTNGWFGTMVWIVGFCCCFIY